MRPVSDSISSRYGSLLLRLNPDMLRGIDAALVNRFLDGCTIHTYASATEILTQGEPTTRAYLVLDGQIEVSFVDVNGNRVLAHLATPGEVMGEVEIFSHRDCAATCTALPSTTVASFTASHIFGVVSAVQLLRNLASIFHDRLTRDNQQQSVAMFYTAEDRIRIHLLGMTSAKKPVVHISQANLAAFAGCSRQTVNQTLSQLRNDGIIVSERGQIHILDRRRLEASKAGNTGILTP